MKVGSHVDVFSQVIAQLAIREEYILLIRCLSQGFCLIVGINGHFIDTSCQSTSLQRPWKSRIAVVKRWNRIEANERTIKGEPQHMATGMKHGEMGGWECGRLLTQRRRDKGPRIGRTRNNVSCHGESWSKYLKAIVEGDESLTWEIDGAAVQC